jgi:glycosyltransferase involved in cell wall biosynthesis
MERLDKQMRILAVIDSLDSSGGAERSLAALSPGLVNEGIGLHVAYLRDRPLTVECDLRDSGAEIHSLVGPGGRVGNIVRIAQLTRQVKPDLVHTTLFEANQTGRAGARLAACRVVTSIVNVAYGPEQTADPGLRAWKLSAARRVDAITARLAVRFHAITAHVADTMAVRLRIPRDRVDVVFRGRNPEELGRRTSARGLAVRSRFGVDEQQPFVLAVGRHERVKGHDVLMRAVPSLVQRWPGLVVAIAGRHGRATPAIKAIIDNSGLSRQVRLLGPRDDVTDLMSAADVFAFPSRSEGLGGAVLEAMALEAPVVASDLPALREVLPSDGALLVQPEDPTALATAIMNCLANRDAANSRAESARRRFLQEFTIERSTAGMIAFYERALLRTRERRHLTQTCGSSKPPSST